MSQDVNDERLRGVYPRGANELRAFRSERERLRTLEAVHVLPDRWQAASLASEGRRWIQPHPAAQ